MDDNVAQPLTDLAEAGAEALVSVMATNAWESAGARIAAVIGMERRMNADDERLGNLPENERAEERAALTSVWRVRLADLLEDHPELADQLRDALTHDQPAKPTAAQQKLEATTTNGSTVIQGGRDVFNDISGKRDVFINSPGNTRGTVGRAAAAGLGAGVAGASVGVATGHFAGGSGGAAAAGGMVASTKVVVVTALVAGTTAVGGGYAAYQHYTCGSIFGDRPAVELLNTAARRIGDASFKFNFRADGIQTTMSGEVDNHNKISSTNGSIANARFDTKQIGDISYYRVSGGQWQSEKGTPKEPGIAQGDPIKTASYLSSAESATQSNCSFTGTMDSQVFLPGSSERPLPFAASISPNNDLTYLKITVPFQERMLDMEWRLYDHGTKVTVTPPTEG
ncbi:hypothetical protein [Lentzea sp. CA-135723]|uniref:hypothetical protein n=1 Tax=Lentzea sp. CA-135723 TaxID=3239950 RepID=UPI003D90815F